MKYCLFDGGDVVGPFTAEQLLLRPGFGSQSLVCPEEHSDEETYWKEARYYEEFGFESVQSAKLPVKPEAVSAAQSERFLKELDNVMTELSSFSVGEKVIEPDQKTKTQKKEFLPKPEPKPKAENKNEPLAKERVQNTAKESPAHTAEEKPVNSLPQSVPVAKKPQSTAKKSAQPEPIHSDTPDESAWRKEKQQAAAPKEQSQSIPAQSSDHAQKVAPRKISSILMEASEEMKREADAVKKENTQAGPAAKAPAVTGKEENKPTEAKTEPLPNPERQLAPETEVVARTVSHLSPIEEYFNTIKSGDLGNILGIPDAKENSDLSLSRALEKQFEKTDPGLAQVEEEDPFDEFTPKDKPQEKEEDLFPTPDDVDKKTEEQLKRSLPDLQTAEPLSLAGQISLEQDPEQDPEKTEPPTLQEMIVPEQEDDPTDKTVQTILEEGTVRLANTRREIQEPIKEVEPQPTKAPASQEEEDAADEFLKERVVKQRPAGSMKFVFLILGVLLLLSGAVLNWLQPKEDSAPAQEPVVVEETIPAQEVQAPMAPSAREVIMKAQPPQDPVELAKEIVQKYDLGQGRGTVEEYLLKRYSKELSSGYAALWSAEPLHRDVYVVKYRLAKTRKEPIVYIFQADTAKKKLTGALNNITLDLVGKIR